jgi:hypothetical protein
MPTLLERLLSPLARAESAQTWPPPSQAERWEKAEDYLRRYTNDADARIQYAPEFSRTSYGRSIYTPLAVAREVCNFSAEMLFSAEPEITFEDNEELLERVLDDNMLASALVDMAAKIAAQGRGGLRVYHDAEVNDMEVPLIDHVYEHEVIWNERGRFVVGGAVIIERNPVTSVGMSADVYRLVEEHVRGGVVRKLYKGFGSMLGSPVPMDTLDEFAGLPEEEDTGLDSPTLIRWDNVSGGYSDLTGAEAVLDRIDGEVSYGVEKSQKSRPVSFAPAELFDAQGRIDLSGIIPIRRSRIRELGEDDLQRNFGTIQPDFLAAETIAWIDSLVDNCLMFMGYSKASYGRDQGGSADSGKALKLRQSRTLLKKAGKDRMATDALRWTLGTAMCWLDGGTRVADYLPEIQLGDGLPRDTMEEVVRMRRPDWDEEQVDLEVERIREASQSQAPTGAEAPPDAIARTRALFDGLGNGSQG